MTPDKPKEIYHYTTGRCFLGIVSDGVIKPATEFVPEGERPAVWFTFSPDWEETCNKLCLNGDGSLRRLSRDETAALDGRLVRFVVDPKYTPYTWREFISRSRIKKDHARILEQSARERGSRVEDWRVVFHPVPYAYWLRVDVWQDGEWRPAFEPATTAKPAGRARAKKAGVKKAAKKKGGAAK